jgi:hypothetical protein
MTEIYIERNSNGEVVGIYSSDPETIVVTVSQGDPLLTEELEGMELLYHPFEIQNRELTNEEV